MGQDRKLILNKEPQGNVYTNFQVNAYNCYKKVMKTNLEQGIRFILGKIWQKSNLIYSIPRQIHIPNVTCKSVSRTTTQNS